MLWRFLMPVDQRRGLRPLPVPLVVALPSVIYAVMFWTATMFSWYQGPRAFLPLLSALSFGVGGMLRSETSISNEVWLLSTFLLATLIVGFASEVIRRVAYVNFASNEARRT